MALMQYCQDNKEKFPQGVGRGYNMGEQSATGLALIYYNEYLTDPEVYLTKYDESGVPAGKYFDLGQNSSYAYIPYFVGGQYGSEMPVCFEKPWRLPGGSSNINVLFCDGSVRSFNIVGVTKMSCRQVFFHVLKQNDPQLAERFMNDSYFLKILDSVDAIR